VRLMGSGPLSTQGVTPKLVDPFGRPITYLRISVTDRCNLRCAYCMPSGRVGWIQHFDLLRADEILHIVAEAVRLGVCKVRLTGGEPLVRPDILNIVRGLAAIPGIEDLSLTTNAVLLEKLAFPLAEAGLQRVNISLDTLQANKFVRITRYGNFRRVWNGIMAAEAAGLTPIKLNTVVVNGFNVDELPALASLTLEHPWHVRFIELMPVGNAQGEWGASLPPFSQRYLSVQDMRARLSSFKLEESIIPGNDGPARSYHIPSALGTVGFISPISDHFCDSCNRLRLTADGRLRACLIRGGEVSIREALRSGRPIDELLLQAVRLKPDRHDLVDFSGGQAALGIMNRIGG
jgi:cyclic pyranopterin phosphate synthase